ncbi:MAG: serine O-acetyltransferase [Aerococcus suis]|nr:serine O-acetyltransferase [Aerococcus suis]
MGKDIKAMMQRLNDLLAAYEANDPAVRSKAEVLLTNQGVHAILFHRLAHKCYNKKWFLLAQIISKFARFLTGVEIHPGAQIGKRLFIDHGMGTVIGETAVVGNDVTIFHGATLGGTGKQKGKRHPNVEDGVLVSANSSVLGNITIGEGSKIGANAVVLEDVPPHVTVVGLPAKIVRYHDETTESK